MPEASIVIVGGGVVGCATAYYLAKAGLRDIVLLERDYLSSGSTGRCAGGIRQQWGTETNVRLAMGSVRLFETLDKELGCDTEYFEGGYLLLARTEKQIEQFRKNIALQNGLGLDCRLITPEEAREVAPALNPEGVLAAAHCRTDGYANPFLVTQAYADAARKLGVEIRLRTEVTGIETSNGKITGVGTSNGRVSARKVMNAAGGYASTIGKMAGLELPVEPVRHQILVTEPVQPLLDPLIVDFHRNIYFRQTRHGGFVMGQSDKDEPSSFNIGSGLEFAEEVAAKFLGMMPSLREISVVRQWAGLYEVTPDSQPILGGVDDLEGYFHAIGFSGHGFMVAPMTAKLMSEFILDGKTSIDIRPLHLNRFEEGKPIVEPNVV